MSSPAEPLPEHDPPAGAAFWVAAVVGIGIMAFGLRGILTNQRATEPTEFAKWFVGADLVHDLVVAPVVAVVGFAVARLVARPWRLPVQAGVFATAVVVAIGWAPLHGYGHASAPGNTTVQPLDYATAVPTVVAVVWLAVGAWLAVIAIRRASARRRPRSAAP